MKTFTVKEIAGAVYDACAIHTTDYNGRSRWECNHCFRSSHTQSDMFNPEYHSERCLVHWAYRNLWNENIAPEDEEEVDIPAVMI